MNDRKVTHDNLPEAVSLLLEKVSNIEKLVKKEEIEDRFSEPDFFTLQEASAYLGYSTQYTQRLNYNGHLKTKRIGKRVLYFKSSVEEYAKSGYKKKSKTVNAENA